MLCEGIKKTLIVLIIRVYFLEREDVHFRLPNMAVVMFSIFPVEGYSLLVPSIPAALRLSVLELSCANTSWRLSIASLFSLQA